MLVNMKEMLADAAKGGYAVGAFNCASLESAVAAVRASEELGVPFVLQHAAVHEPYLPLAVAGPIMLQLARGAKTPVAVHLDHGASVAHCLRALAMGFTSVMFDGSALPFGENAAATAQIVKTAHELGATVEAELGSLPCNFDGTLGDYAPEDFYTRPDEAVAFAEKTGVDALAISFGTVHGLYKTAPKLSFEVVARVRDATGGLPLVMHGGSGLSDADYRAAIAAGVRKVNYYTYGALAGGRAVRDLVRREHDSLQFHEVAVAATDAIAEDVKRVMKVLGGTASLGGVMRRRKWAGEQHWK
ncbi:MAG: class II fructose-bisphosphate aldolase [Kiritimatiellae bacterium]|nr:class II fructose-bisphosphate aldolase [Kiritimatiellia bacterium]